MGRSLVGQAGSACAAGHAAQRRGQLIAAADLELAVAACEMGLDRAHAQRELLGDPPVAVALRRQSRHTQLSRSELLPPAAQPARKAGADRKQLRLGALRQRTSAAGACKPQGRLQRLAPLSLARLAMSRRAQVQQRQGVLEPRAGALKYRHRLLQQEQLAPHASGTAEGHAQRKRRSERARARQLLIRQRERRPMLSERLVRERRVSPPTYEHRGLDPKPALQLTASAKLTQGERMLPGGSEHAAAGLEQRKRSGGFR